MIKVGDQYIFNARTRKGLAGYNGTRTKIIKQLTAKLYKAQFNDGYVCEVWEEELSELKDIVATVEITVEKVTRIACEVKVTQEQLDKLKNGDNPFYDEIFAVGKAGAIEYDYAVNDLDGNEIVPWSKS